jgi:hypothetical protein
VTAPASTVAAGGVQLVDTPGRPARPGAPADYWQRVERIAAAAPPLSDTQAAIIRAAFFQPAIKEAA